MFVLIACKNKSESTSLTEKDGTEIENNIPEKTTEKNPSENLVLLQGTWRNVLDPLSTIVFEGNTSQNLYDGLETGKTILFTIDSTCKNGSNPAGSEEVDKYISTTGSAEECYYIVTLDEENLVMSFLGKGNTLTFKKI